MKCQSNTLTFLPDLSADPPQAIFLTQPSSIPDTVTLETLEEEEGGGKKRMGVGRMGRMGRRRRRMGVGRMGRMWRRIVTTK